MLQRSEILGTLSRASRVSVLSIVWLAACVGSLDESTSTQGSYLTDAGSGSGSGSDGGTTVDAGSGSGSDVGSDGGTPDAGSGSGSAGGCTGAPELPKPGI